MPRTKVVFMGSRPLGHHALKILTELRDVDIVGRIVRQPPPNAWWALDPYYFADIPVVEYKDLSSLDYDLGVSVNYWKLIDSSEISKASLGFLNIHHSYMLSLRGRDMATHAILNARSTGRWYHGTTLHYINQELDTGPIISSESCEITESDTAWSLFQKTEGLARTMLALWLPRLVISRSPVAAPEPSQPLNLRGTAPSKHIDDVHADPIKTYDKVRAYDFNKHYEPAFTIVDGRRIFLTTQEADGAGEMLRLDSMRSIYRMNYSSL